MVDITYVKGGTELIEEIKSLWESLNGHHKEKTTFFRTEMTNNTFENRHEKFNENDLDVYIEIAKVEDLAIGYVLASIDKELRGEIDSLYVEKDYRKSSIGEVFMNNVLTWFNKNGTKSNQLKVAEGNEHVLQYYKKFGFETRYYVLEEVSKD